MTDYKTTIKTMLEKGQDPKEYMIEVCRPECKAKFDKLQRCEYALKNMTNADPELSCMYPFRDWVTCIDGCVSSRYDVGAAKDTRPADRERERFPVVNVDENTDKKSLTIENIINFMWGGGGYLHSSLLSILCINLFSNKNITECKAKSISRLSLALQVPVLPIQGTPTTGYSFILITNMLSTP